MNYRFGRTLAGPLFFGTMLVLPPLVLAEARPGPGSRICFLAGPVVLLINAIALILQSLKATFTLSGSTCLVLLPLTARAVKRLGMVVDTVVAEIPTKLTALVLLPLLLAL
jgi:fumarate reductase subunit C